MIREEEPEDGKSEIGLNHYLFPVQIANKKE